MKGGIVMKTLQEIKDMFDKQTSNLPMEDKHIRIAARKIKEEEGDLALITYASAIRRYAELKEEYADKYRHYELNRVPDIFEAIAIEVKEERGCMLW